MKKTPVRKAFAAIIVTFTIAWAASCGNDHSAVNPVNPPASQTKVAFNSGRGTGNVTGEPFIMNRNDGTDVTPIPYSGLPAIPRGVTVSPDGSKVLAEIDGSQPTQVYTASPDGTGWTARTSSGSNRCPRWSPDGKLIVFYSNRDGNPGPRKIYVMNADGSGQTSLSPVDAANDIFPSFSPDGKQIVFLGWDTTANAYAVLTMNIDGSNRKSVVIPTDIPITPAFSPDGNKILWVDNGEISAVNLDGGGQTVITDSGGMISELMVVGTEVWFTTRQDENSEVYKMNADGSGQKNMTNNPYADSLDLNVP